MNVSERLLREVMEQRPDLYQKILKRIQPHTLCSVARIMDKHLLRFNLELFNQHREKIPEFCWAIIKHMKFPSPGDAFGIHLTCRITKLDTQCTLDSKHLNSSRKPTSSTFNVENKILYELAIFTNQRQVFEFAANRGYATVFVKDISIQELLQRIPKAGYLERGGPLNKGKDQQGQYHYLNTFQFIVVQDLGNIKILYQATKDLFCLLKNISPRHVVAFTDVRNIFRKCGIVCHFFNMVEVVRKQLLHNEGSVYEKDILTIIKYQCLTGTPLPLTRNGLAKNPDRTPLEVLSFEAPKKNYTRLCTNESQWFDVKTSMDKIFFGQRFNEGTGYSFSLLPDFTKSTGDDSNISK